MTRTAVLILAAALLAAPAAVRAEASGPDHFRVAGVAEDDMLNLRAEADAGARRLGAIPPGADGLANLGCVGGLSYAEWAEASEAERAAAARTRWCRVRWKGLEGWVAARYLAEGSAPAEARILSSWRLAGAPPGAGAEIAFLRGGRVAGSTGCNSFSGAARVEDGRLVVPGPLAVTRMACPPERQALEDRVLAVLRGAPAIAFDPLADALTLSTGALSLSLRR